MTVTPETASTVLDEIAALAVKHFYFPNQFRVLIEPPSRSMLGPVFGAQLAARMRARMLKDTWTVMRNEQEELVGFASTHELPRVVKTREIQWYFIVSEHAATSDGVLLRHIEQHDCAGYADLVFNAELDVALWRRLRCQEFSTGVPRVLFSGQHPNLVIDMAKMVDEFAAIGAPICPEAIAPDVAANFASVAEYAKSVAAADEFIDSGATVGAFREKFPSMIQSHFGLETLPLVRPIITNVFLPAGPHHIGKATQ